MRRTNQMASGLAERQAWTSRQRPAAELEEIVKQRLGAGDFKVTVHRNPETGWHATIYGRHPSEVHRCQVMAQNIVTELSQYYDLAD